MSLVFVRAWVCVRESHLARHMTTRVNKLSVCLSVCTSTSTPEKLNLRLCKNIEYIVAAIYLGAPRLGLGLGLGLINQHAARPSRPSNCTRYFFADYSHTIPTVREVHTLYAPSSHHIRTLLAPVRTPGDTVRAVVASPFTLIHAVFKFAQFIPVHICECVIDTL